MYTPNIVKFAFLLKEPLILDKKGIKIGFLGYCDHVPDYPNCTAMRKLYKSGPAIYRDDIATRDVNKLKKVQLTHALIWLCSCFCRKLMSEIPLGYIILGSRDSAVVRVLTSNQRSWVRIYRLGLRMFSLSHAHTITDHFILSFIHLTGSTFKRINLIFSDNITGEIQTNAIADLIAVYLVMY